MPALKKICAFAAVSLFVVCAAAAGAYADTHTAASASYADVSAAVTAAASGDTVVVPAGTASWSSSLNITKAIKLLGAGVGNTVINNTLNSQYGYTLISYTPASAEASKVFELAGFTLNGANIGGCFQALAPGSTTPITGLKIHDNSFINGKSRAVILPGLEYGVFYNNTFSNNYISISAIGATDGGWNYPHAFGSANYAYFEDNTFGNGAGAFLIEGGQGGRIAFRHNTVTGYACSGCEVFDLHGTQGDRGTVSAEIYHNTINVGSSGTYRFLHHRGGQALIANNTVNRYISFEFTEYRSWGGNGLCQSYPADDQVNNSFYWNNGLGGSVRTPTHTICDDKAGTTQCGSSPYDCSYIVQNREYWLPTYGPEASLPATCTADGNTYYGTTDTDKIYKCTSANVWTVQYQPYPYPHPLATGAVTHTVSPSAGSNGSISPAAQVSVAEGSTVQLTITPNTGYSASVGGTCGGTLTGTTYATNAITADCTVIASFSAVPITYTVTPSAGTNGSISPAAPGTVTKGSTTQFTVTPNAGYTANVGGTCGGSLTGTTYTTVAINANCTVIAAFSAVVVTHTVTPSAGSNGSISPSSLATVVDGSTAQFTITPNAGYSASVGGGCGGTLTGTTFKTNAVSADCTVAATFSKVTVTYTVTPSTGSNGSISPAAPIMVSEGSTTQFTVTPSAGYIASVGGTCGGNLSLKLYTTNAVTADCTVAATFSKVPVMYTVTPSAGPNGSISPAASGTVAENATAQFTVTPNTGYSASVGGTCGGTLTGTTYTTNAVTADCTVLATFTTSPGKARSRPSPPKNLNVK